MKKIILFLFFVFSLVANAQYTAVINSNRPGFSESPYSVGRGVYQLESNIFYRRLPTTRVFSTPSAFGTNLLLRTGFLSEQLEFSLDATFRRDERTFKNVFSSSYYTYGFSVFTLGAKYLVYQSNYVDKAKEIHSWKRRYAFDWNRLIPSVAFYGGVNIGSFLSDAYKREGLSPKVGILLQNNLTTDFNLITNFYYNYIGDELPEFSYIITGTYSFTNRLSAFMEGQSVFNNRRTTSNLGFGLAYLYTKNFQFNASARALFEKNTTGIYAGLGVSYRIDHHRIPAVRAKKQ